MAACFLGLGGNLGSVEETFRDARRRLDAHPRIKVQRSSTLHSTAAVGERAGDTFRNAALQIGTDLPPLELLTLLQTVEREFGRTRGERWGPRTLDLDILLYGDEIIEEVSLMVPHPACWYRRFVLDPLVEIAAGVVHPDKGVTVAELRARLVHVPFHVALTGGSDALRVDLIHTLKTQFQSVKFSHWVRADNSADANPTLLVWLGSEADNRGRFDELPRVPRLDASAADDRNLFLQHVLQSALGG